MKISRAQTHAVSWLRAERASTVAKLSERLETLETSRYTSLSVSPAAPNRPQSRWRERPSLSKVPQRQVKALLCTTALRFCAGFTIAVWALPCFRGAFPERAADFGAAYGLVVAVCGTASALLGGQLADALAQRERTAALPWPFARNANAARALVPFVGTAVAAPLWWLALHAPSFEQALGWLALEFFAAECWIGPTTALLQSECAPDSRGTAQGIFTATTLVGNLAPLGIGLLLSNQPALSPTPVVGAVVAAAYLSSALGFLAVAATTKDQPTEDKAA